MSKNQILTVLYGDLNQLCNCIKKVPYSKFLYIYLNLSLTQLHLLLQYTFPQVIFQKLLKNLLRRE